MFTSSRKNVFGLALLPLLVSGPFSASLLSGLQEFIISILKIIFEAIYGAASMLTLSLIKAMLMFPPPGDIPGLTTMYYEVSFPLFIGFLGLMTSYFFLMAELFPESSNADLERFATRVFIAVVLVLVVGQMYDLAVESMNLMQDYLWPEEYRVVIGGSALNALGSTVASGMGIVIFAFIGSFSLVITFAAFMLMLGARMVLIYMVYALFPLFAVWWIVDIGPATYLKMVSGFAFKAAALMMLFGIVIASILGVSGALVSAAGAGAGASTVMDSPDASDVNIEFVGGGVDRDTMKTGVFADGGGGGVGAASGGSVSIASSWFRVFVYFAALWLVVSVTSMVLGVASSTGLSTMRRKTSRMKKGINSRKSKGGSSSSASAGDTGSGAGGNGADTTAPGPDNVDADGVSMKDKARNIGSQAADKVKSGVDRADDTVAGGKGKGMKDSALDKVESAKDMSSEDVGGAVESAGKAVGGSAYSKVDPRVEKMSKKAGSAAEKGASAASSVASKTASAGKFAASGAKRGAKAYGSVLKQPTLGHSIGKAHDMARKSPIGHPNAGKTKGERNLEGAASTPATSYLNSGSTSGEAGGTSEWADGSSQSSSSSE